MIIRPETYQDWNQIRALTISAFGGDAEADLIQGLRQGSDLELSLIAKDSGHLLGHVAFSRLKAPSKALALAPIAVHPDHQRKGIGSKLISEGLRKLTNEGWKMVVVLGDPVYYKRFGFSVKAAEAYTSDYAGPNLMAKMLTPETVAPGPLIYPDAFADMS